MEYVFHCLTFEVTRRCNLVCKHCMRGKAQNIDLSKEMVDDFFSNNSIKRIEHLFFSGGEPTLNSELIIYIINKIIQEQMDVLEIAFVTNGQQFSLELVEALNRFYDYRMESLTKKYGIHREELFFMNPIRITFSIDSFHKPICSEVKELLNQYGKRFSITYFEVPDDEIIKTGNADFGLDYNYKLDIIRYSSKEDAIYFIIDLLYVTSTGFITSNGMGMYSDMDALNMGHLSSQSIGEILFNYGTPIFGTTPIKREDLIKKRILK